MRHATARARGTSDAELPIELTLGPIGSPPRLSRPKQIWPSRPANPGPAPLAGPHASRTPRAARATESPTTTHHAHDEADEPPEGQTSPSERRTHERDTANRANG